LNCFDGATLLSKFLFCDLGDLFEDRTEFVGRAFQGQDTSTLEPDFEGETPGDILGVNIYDPELTREKLKAAARKIFFKVHPDKFNPKSQFSITHKIDCFERANSVFNKYKLAYDSFCKAKKWG
jgi:hypothetical protein